MDCNRISGDKFAEVFGSDAESEAIHYECHGVVFSAVRKGDAIVTHVGCKRDNMRNLRKGCETFIGAMFELHAWCKMLIATVSIEKPSVVNLCHKLGFKSIGVYRFENGMANVMVIEQ